MSKYFRILSIDGGGIRGIIPGQVLVELEKLLKNLTNDNSARIGEYFDLIAGTSTGGILTCIYLCPQKNNKKNSRFSAQEAVDLYFERGDEIFDVSFWHKIKTVGGLTDEKYSADELEEALEDYFGGLKLSELIKPCLVTAYDIKRRRTYFFTQHNAKKKGDFFVKEVARATSAAPTYFESVRVKSLSNITYPMIDGGVFANNPTLCAYAEARTINYNSFNRPTAKDMVILSLGTGKVKKPYYYKEAKDWGLVEWIKPVLDIMMSGVSEIVDYQIQQIFDAVGHPEQYLRIEPDLGNASSEMDDASMENLNALKNAGISSAKKYSTQMKNFAQLLLQ